MIGGPNISRSKQHRHGSVQIPRRPFWAHASGYYVLTVAVSIAFFFLTWGVLNDLGEGTPWITAGIAASMLLGGAVILREVILRRALHVHTLREPGIAQKFAGVQYSSPRGRNKLTIEKNSAILAEIKQKSNAAKLLSKISAGHREVFEVSSEYIQLIENELKTINAGSPRLASLLNGRKSAEGFHRYHLLQWAEIEATSLTAEAHSQVEVSDKIKSSKDALGVIEFALQHYPAEKSLLESRAVLQEMVVSIRVADLVEKAELAVYKDDLRGAMSLYRDALFYLGRDNLQSQNRQQAADHINAEIDKIRLLEGGE